MAPQDWIASRYLAGSPLVFRQFRHERIGFQLTITSPDHDVLSIDPVQDAFVIRLADGIDSRVHMCCGRRCYRHRMYTEREECLDFLGVCIVISAHRRGRHSHTFLQPAHTDGYPDEL